MAPKLQFVIRIRGGIDIPWDTKDTLRMLRVDRNNTATLLLLNDSYLGMLRKGKDHITWGTPSAEMLKEIILKRGRLVGDHPITEEALKELGYEGVDNLVAKLLSGELDYASLGGIKPFFRMHPPKHGFKKTVKRPYRDNGELGDRGDAINELAKRMC